MDSKKALEKKEHTEKLSIVAKQGSKVRALSWLIILASILSGYTLPLHTGKTERNIIVADGPEDTFPVPRGIKNQLFYLQKTPNTNTIVCELNFNDKGEIDPDNPVHVFWIRYKEFGQRAELSFIQRTFAYGVKSKPLGNGEYEIHFVSYKKKPFYIIKSSADNKYHAYAQIGNKLSILNRIFIKINPGGTFWSPNVEYIELKGVDPITGKEVM
ncbi:MAG: DUF4833 domain-containing protein [Bacteroidetes bacterium]|nr:DUF4833 domain-containing protein [Bacteroidota bacterium]